MRRVPDVTRLLEMFFAVKPQRMALACLPDVFSDDGVKTFLREACLAGLESGQPAIVIHALEWDGSESNHGALAGLAQLNGGTHQKLARGKNYSRSAAQEKTRAAED